MVELSPANLELGLEPPLSKRSVDFPEAPCSLTRPLDAGGTLRGQAGLSRLRRPPVRLLVQHLNISCCQLHRVITGGFRKTRQAKFYFVSAPADYLSSVRVDRSVVIAVLKITRLWAQSSQHVKS